MSLTIRGMGWVTPLGIELDAVWQRLMAGESAPVSELPPISPGRQAHFAMRVPPGQFGWLERLPRIRRSSEITYYSVAAALAALADAHHRANGPSETPELAGKSVFPLPAEVAAGTAIIFAIGNGGVQYTRRFYERVVKDGPPAASPLLFPETVYNAPASHVAAILGIDTATYTLVGDASVGIAALHFAEELLATQPGLEQCVVVGADECDGIITEAYASWRLLAHTPCVRLHSDGAAGTILAEAAGALVVGRAKSPVTGAAGREIGINTAIASYFRRARAGEALQAALGRLSLSGCELIVGSANGTWVDSVEQAQLHRHLPDASTFYPKAALGESGGAAGLVQVIAGALAMQHGVVPPPVISQLPAESPLDAGISGDVVPNRPIRKVLISSLGLVQQAAAAVLEMKA